MTVDSAIARIERLEGALRECSLLFDEYAGHHMNKTPPDVAKAARNRDMVDFIARVLSEGEADAP